MRQDHCCFTLTQTATAPAVIYGATTSCVCALANAPSLYHSLSALGLEAFRSRVMAQVDVSDLSLGAKSQVVNH